MPSSEIKNFKKLRNFVSFAHIDYFYIEGEKLVLTLNILNDGKSLEATEEIYSKYCLIFNNISEFNYTPKYKFASLTLADIMQDEEFFTIFIHEDDSDEANEMSFYSSGFEIYQI